MSKENLNNFMIPPLTGISNLLQKRYPQPQIKNCSEYLHELLALQYEVNQQLLINEILTNNYLKQMDDPNGKACSSEGSTIPGGSQNAQNKKNQKRLPNYKIVEKLRKDRKPKQLFNTKSDSQYEPSNQQQNVGQYKLSESKNVPKNYGKSILHFIKKNQRFVRRVLQKYGKDFTQFEDYISKNKNNINTIAQLRSLWLDGKNNKFAKQMRIISAQYLRKHSLGHIFNSRVQNFAKNIKYRQKILQAIANPQKFTQMKDF